jgi:hypothetical protein
MITAGKQAAMQIHDKAGQSAANCQHHESSHFVLSAFSKKIYDSADIMNVER